MSVEVQSQLAKVVSLILDSAVILPVQRQDSPQLMSLAADLAEVWCYREFQFQGYLAVQVAAEPDNHLDFFLAV
jgi:hypothetical protein